MVDFNNDIGKYLNLFVAEYEKANIWPEYESREEADGILVEEIEEAKEKVGELVAYSDRLGIAGAGKVELINIKAHSVSAICELLQVMSVCEKYEKFLDKVIAKRKSRRMTNILAKEQERNK